MAGLCWISITNYGVIGNPLYGTLKGHDLQALTWTRMPNSLCDNKSKVSTLALGLLDLKKPFKLCVHERKGISLGVLIQTLGNIPRLVSYFSKQLEQTVKRWPPCLQAVAASCDILQETENFTLGQPPLRMFLIMSSLCWNRKGVIGWLLGKYQAILLDNPNVRI